MDGYQARCKPCNIQSRLEHYRDNREQTKAVNARWDEREREWYNEQKNRPCCDCGVVYHPAAMQWDHRPGETKVDAVANLRRLGRSRKTILDEIEKCDILCANCHAIRTWQRTRAKGAQEQGSNP